MKTLVLFRVWRKGSDVLALFPLDPEDRSGYLCGSYQHVGQHSAADPYHCMRATRPAKPAEYRDLARELRSAPYHYKLKIGRRIPRNAAEIRRAA